MTFFGWKKRCRQVEAENARLRERSAQLEGRLAEVEAKGVLNPKSALQSAGYLPVRPLTCSVADAGVALYLSCWPVRVFFPPRPDR